MGLVLHCESKKTPTHVDNHRNMSIDFRNSPTAKRSKNFATKHSSHIQSHLKDVAAPPPQTVLCQKSYKFKTQPTQHLQKETE